MNIRIDFLTLCRLKLNVFPNPKKVVMVLEHLIFIRKVQLTSTLRRGYECVEPTPQICQGMVLN
jgi:hypothetical protein